MNRDRYLFLGDRQLVADYDAAFAAVRAIWPTAHVEGSTGAERTFYVGPSGRAGLVAHCWPRRFREEAMFLRCLSADETPFLDEDMPAD